MKPKLIKVRQKFEAKHVNDVGAAVREELARSGIGIRKGSRIALAVGSRGISEIPTIVRAVSDWVKAQGGEPFIVPSMGSHGGATAEGQVEILASIGITEEAMGTPIQSSMTVVELPRGDLENNAFMDKHAYESDGVILINRIKLHTDFHGPYESGLAKMMVIGLGKHRGALEMHGFGVRGLRDLMPKTAEHILGTGKILLGLALIGNAYDEICDVHAVRSEKIMHEEPLLLDTARKNMPSLPVDDIDVLIVDRMGKNISGMGLDPNIVGRMRIRGQPEPTRPQIKSIVVADLTDETLGNALGFGLADVITRRLFERIDFGPTYENLITTTFLERGKIPVVAEHAERAFEIALRACGPLLAGQERIVRIQDTLHLGEAYVSPAILEGGSARIEEIGQLSSVFDEQGELTPF